MTFRSSSAPLMEVLNFFQASATLGGSVLGILGILCYVRMLSSFAFEASGVPSPSARVLGRGWCWVRVVRVVQMLRILWMVVDARLCA